MKDWFVRALRGAAMLVVVAVMPAGVAGAQRAAAIDRQAPTSADEVRLSYAPIVKEVATAVVNVYASRQVQQPANDFFNDPFFQRFFGDNGQAQQRVSRSLGSGVIVSADGVMVTNVHVIADATAIRVALADQQEVDAEIVLRDPQSDIAVLRLPATGAPYPYVELSDSDKLEVGDIVLAIGNPFGVGQTVTSGIISGLARTHVSPSEYQYFIQTDAAINPGNSGGALIDMGGRLAGINTAIFTRSGGSDGIGFAIPSNMARVVIAAAISGEPLRRPWIGAHTQEITADIAAGLGIQRPRGALVANVVADGPVSAAGIAAGDVIVAIDGVTVEDPSALNYRLATAGIGRSVRFTVLHDGASHDVDVALIAAPETVARDERTIDGFSPFVGAVVANLSPAVAEELGYSGNPEGVIVLDVPRGSIADQIGLRAGDVVMEINGASVDSTEKLATLSAARSRLWRFAIERDGRVLQSVIGG